MPAIVSGTVILWEAVIIGQHERVRQVNSRSVSVYRAGESDAADATMLVADYILTPPTGKTPTDLLNAARQGLLEVVAITPVPVTPPSPP
jgi:hypothetical protein